MIWVNVIVYKINWLGELWLPIGGLFQALIALKVRQVCRATVFRVQTQTWTGEMRYLGCALDVNLTLHTILSKSSAKQKPSIRNMSENFSTNICALKRAAERVCSEKGYSLCYSYV